MTQPANRKQFVVERSTIISAPPDTVFGYLADFHRWIAWSPWEGIDEDLHRTYGGPDSGVGATYEWVGNRQAGQGRMEITDADPPTGLGIKLDFIKPFTAQNFARFALRPDGDATRVTWTMIGTKNFATRLVGLFMSMDKLVGRDFDKGLAQLKTLVEA